MAGGNEDPFICLWHWQDNKIRAIHAVIGLVIQGPVMFNQMGEGGLYKCRKWWYSFTTQDADSWCEVKLISQLSVSHLLLLLLLQFKIFVHIFRTACITCYDIWSHFYSFFFQNCFLHHKVVMLCSSMLWATYQPLGRIGDFITFTWQSYIIPTLLCDLYVPDLHSTALQSYILWYLCKSAIYVFM